MIIVKVLKRKDAASIAVAVVLAGIITQLLPSLTSHLAGLLLGLREGTYISYASPGSDFKTQYLYPVVLAVLEILLLEILIWLYVLLGGVFKDRKK